MAGHAKGPLRLVLSGLPIGFVRFSGILPLSIARFLGKLFGRLAYYLVPRLRRIGVANLDLAYGDSLEPKEKKQIIQRAVCNLGLVSAEFGHIKKLSYDAMDRLVNIEGLEHINKDQGFVLIGAHYGNWEWMPPVLQRHGLKMAVVYRPLDDPWMDHFIADVRGTGGVLPIPKSAAGGDLLRHMRDGGVAGILIDQSPRESAVPITFFGERTWATAAPALLAARAKVPIHTAFMVRRPDGGYTLTVGAAIEQRRSNDRRGDLLENSQRCHAALEAAIREHPDHWLWFHRRWKARPQLEEAWHAREERNKDQRAQ